MKQELNCKSEDCEVFDSELLGKLQALRGRLDDVLKWKVSVNNYLRDWTDINNPDIKFSGGEIESIRNIIAVFDSIFKEEIKEIKRDKQA